MLYQLSYSRVPRSFALEPARGNGARGGQGPAEAKSSAASVLGSRRARWDEGASLRRSTQ